MKILLIGEYYSSNLGDPVLCKTVESVIQNSYPNAEIVIFDISGRTNYNTFYEPIKYSFSQKWYMRFSYRLPMICNLSARLRICKLDESRHLRVACMLNHYLDNQQFDLAIFAGGSLFMDYFAGVIELICRKLYHADVPVIFHACGMSTLTKDTKKVLQYALNYKNVKRISLRDSYDLFQSLFKSHAIITQTYDTALLCSEIFNVEYKKTTDYGIGIIADEQYYNFQKHLIFCFFNSSKNWKLFTNGSAADERFADMIFSDLGISNSEDYRMPRPKTAKELIQTITSFEQIISFRMHSHIIASSYGIPNYGYIWNPKVAEQYKKLGLGGNCAIPEGAPDIAEMSMRLKETNPVFLKSSALARGNLSADCLLDEVLYCLED